MSYDETEDKKKRLMKEPEGQKLKECGIGKKKMMKGRGSYEEF